MYLMVMMYIVDGFSLYMNLLAILRSVCCVKNQFRNSYYGSLKYVKYVTKPCCKQSYISRQLENIKSKSTESSTLIGQTSKHENSEGSDELLCITNLDVSQQRTFKEMEDSQYLIFN